MLKLHLNLLRLKVFRVSVCRDRIGNLQLELGECCHDSPNLQFYASQSVLFLRQMT